MTATLCVAGASTAVGAVAVRLSCAGAGALHAVVEHAIGPLVLGLRLALPVSVWLALRGAMRFPL